MKFIIFGATGPSGQQAVLESLERGHEVVALVRNPDKIQTKHEKLQVHKIDIFEENDITPHMAGCDAVLSCLGTGISYFTAVTLYTESMKSIIGAMRKNNVERLVVMTAWCTVYKPEHPKFIEWFLKPLFLGRILTNMAQMEDYLEKECSDIEYTCVRPPGLANSPSSGKELASHEGQFVPNSRGSVSRRDVAKFMIDCVEKKEWLKKAVAIGAPPK